MEKINRDISRRLGQNFILDDDYLRDIVSSLKLPKDSNILEIGSGRGNLSSVLAQNFKKVISFEIDKKFMKYLEPLGRKFNNLTFIIKDILKFSILDIEKMFNYEKYYIVSNLPYYITSPIIFKFLFNSRCLLALFVMVQKEIAIRYTSKEGNREYGKPSVLLQTFCKLRIIREVKREVFTPIPKVDSCMVEIIVNRNKFKALDVLKYQKFISLCFKMKRKTLLNNLCKAGYKKEVVLKAILSLNLDVRSRPEELSPATFVRLFKMLKDKLHSTYN